MLGKVFGILVISSFITGGVTGRMEEVCNAILAGADEAVILSISLLGIMCLWSGVIRVLDKAGLTKILAKIIGPVLKLIYPSSYTNKTAMDSVAADYSANFLGLGNAALPIGIKAMKELKKTGLSDPFTANNDMVLFATLNTTPLQLIPTTLIALRSTHLSSNPFEIIAPIWICSILTTVFGVILCKLLSKIFK